MKSVCRGLAILLLGVWATVALPSAYASFNFDPGSIPGGIPGGIPTGIPPFVLTTSPSNGAKGVALDSPISFSFFSAMSPAQSIAWSGNGLDASKFSYNWSADGKTLTATYGGNLPANTTITWVLDPTVFKDQSGTALLAVNNSGTFTTGSGSGSGSGNNNCSGSATNSNTGAIGVYKSLHYIQTSASAPVLDTNNPVTFIASAVGPQNDAVSQATLQLPDGSTKTLSGFGGNFFVFDQFDTQAEMDQAYPAGPYKMMVQFSSGKSGTVTLNLSGNPPPTPQIVNFAQTQTYDPTADVTLQWLPFTNPGPTDSIFLSISDQTTDFFAPDYCVPRPLKVTDTSILIPKNTFGVGGTMDGTLSFNSTGGYDTNSIPGVPAFAAYMKQTEFTMKSGGGTTPPPTQPQLMNLVRQAQTGAVSFQVKASAGTSLVVEGSNDLVTWTVVPTGAVGAAGILDVSDPGASGSAHRFYRAKSQ